MMGDSGSGDGMYENLRTEREWLIVNVQLVCFFKDFNSDCKSTRKPLKQGNNLAFARRMDGKVVMVVASTRKRELHPSGQLSR